MGLFGYTQPRHKSNRPMARFSPASTAWENFSASMNYMMDTEVSWSSLRNNEMFMARNEKLRDMVVSGQIPDNALTTFRGDEGALAWYANKKLGIDIPTDQDLRVEQGKVIQEAGMKLSEIRSRATLGGKVAGFAGSVAGASADWDLPISMMIGGVGGVYKGLSVAKALMRGAAIGAVMEAPRQVAVQRFKKSRYLGTNAQEMVENILYAGLGESIGTGIAAAVGKANYSKPHVDKALKNIEHKWIAKEGRVPEAVANQVDFLKIGGELEEQVPDFLNNIQAKADAFENVESIFKKPSPVRDRLNLTLGKVSNKIAAIDDEIRATIKLTADTKAQKEKILKAVQRKRQARKDVRSLKEDLRLADNAKEIKRIKKAIKKAKRVKSVNVSTKAQDKILEEQIALFDALKRKRSLEQQTADRLTRQIDDYAPETKKAEIVPSVEVKAEREMVETLAEKLSKEKKIELGPKAAREQVEGVTTHPADEFTFLSKDDREWLKANDAEVADEILDESAMSNILEACLLNNGVKI